MLAAIALPQYQMAVGKAKFSELKTLTKSLQQSVQRYYMIYNTYDDLNTSANRKKLDIELSKENDCTIGFDDNNIVRCCKKILKERMCFYVNRETGLPYFCTILTNNKTGKAHRLCQLETGKNTFPCWTGYCSWEY